MSLSLAYAAMVAIVVIWCAYVGVRGLVAWWQSR